MEISSIAGIFPESMEWLCQTFSAIWKVYNCSRNSKSFEFYFQKFPYKFHTMDFQRRVPVRNCFRKRQILIRIWSSLGYDNTCERWWTLCSRSWVYSGFHSEGMLTNWLHKPSETFVNWHIKPVKVVPTSKSGKMESAGTQLYFPNYKNKAISLVIVSKVC